VPESCRRLLGKTHSERAATMIKDLISSSTAEDGVFHLRPSRDVHNAMLELRQFMFEQVYRSRRVQQDFEKSKKILTELYAYFLADEDMLRQGLADLQMGGVNHNGEPRERLVCDFIASMTDRYAMNLYANLFFPSPFTQKVN
jgi:dGTPase